MSINLQPSISLSIVLSASQSFHLYLWLSLTNHYSTANPSISLHIVISSFVYLSIYFYMFISLYLPIHVYLHIYLRTHLIIYQFYLLSTYSSPYSSIHLFICRIRDSISSPSSFYLIFLWVRDAASPPVYPSDVKMRAGVRVPTRSDKGAVFQRAKLRWRAVKEVIERSDKMKEEK